MSDQRERNLSQEKPGLYQVEHLDDMEKGLDDPISQSPVPADIQRRIRRQVCEAQSPITQVYDADSIPSESSLIDVYFPLSAVYTFFLILIEEILEMRRPLVHRRLWA